MWRNDVYSSKSDMWSLGCCFYEMLTLMLPFAAPSMDQLYEKVTNGIYERIPKHYSSDA